MTHATDARPVEYIADQTLCEGWFVPAAISNAPLVVVCHDWSGVNVHTKAQCEELRDMGYAAFALDAYGKGKRGDPRGDNTDLMAPMMEDRALLGRRLRAGFDHARGLSGVDASRCAVLGHCFGGLCALDLTRQGLDGLRCATSVHGVLTPAAGSAPSRFDTTVLLLHGWDDPLAPPSDVLAITRELTEAGAPWELVAYGHALHAFTFEGANVPSKGIQYHPRAARRAKRAIRDVLAETLAGTAQTSG